MCPATRRARILLDECFRVEGRKTWYLGPDEIQADLDRFMAYYNFGRTHQGYRVGGRTPARALLDGLGLARLPLLAAATPSEAAVA
jgi:hypothetical protein